MGSAESDSAEHELLRSAHEVLRQLTASEGARRDADFRIEQQVMFSWLVASPQNAQRLTTILSGENALSHTHLWCRMLPCLRCKLNSHEHRTSWLVKRK